MINKNKFFTLGQVMILVFGIVAISWAVGKQIPVLQESIKIKGGKF
jgi:hypothetical protein